ncbi:CoA-binding protein [Methylobacterium aerolatum]|uniref:CoA-binding protein n=1 Tax=Methylobacterium aerolatum TaxID=418708 RepID=A0ABU0HZX4_9HYPH|nr:CoA-binding protein [Methylobacterium aerolatum]MDQ0447903.1 putative CoA-binding protein [Methylobacterium aerolatum]GJD34390.1 hypothetical protein FMGBMHLM_1289 [Methylobacterium aerolatum]
MTEIPDDLAARHARYPDAAIRAILDRTRHIALVGASANPARPSWIVLKYLLARGYAVTPVNPGLAGQDLLGQRVVATLAEAQAARKGQGSSEGGDRGGSEGLDMVEIFRNSAAAGPLVDEALALDPLPATIWMQLGVRDDAAAARAEARGVTVVMNRCPKIEYGRLSGEIGWTGVNSRILSARKPVLAKGGVQKLTIADRRGPRS